MDHDITAGGASPPVRTGRLGGRKARSLSFRSFHRSVGWGFLVARRREAAGDQAGRRFQVGGLHQHAFLAVRQVRLALARRVYEGRGAGRPVVIPPGRTAARRCPPRAAPAGRLPESRRSRRRLGHEPPHVLQPVVERRGDAGRCRCNDHGWLSGPGRVGAPTERVATQAVRRESRPGNRCGTCRGGRIGGSAPRNPRVSHTASVALPATG